MAMISVTELDDDTVRKGGKINSVDFDRKDDLLVTASEDDSVRLYDIASAKSNHYVICQCMIIDVFATSKAIKPNIASLVISTDFFREFCIYVVDPQLHTTNKVLSLLWHWKWVLLNCDSRSYGKGPFDTFLVGGGTAEVCDIKFSNDGKSMLLTTTCNNICVLDAYGGDKFSFLGMDTSVLVSLKVPDSLSP
ncbi:hypothetical protein SADUNF_Sadunf17G0063900 [Salix dunnii]|uniref:Uncharacterized protein n=1 Tax=Salix dunnii TaxID=1413687 RepID=A0A835J6S5_9ROSI|nr:hypothetical protein SADUNF_Sadunf17G0063900 [Salix dunnii]